LTPEEEKRAYEMLEVQAAYLQILDAMSYVIDPEGHIHDLSAMEPTRLAIAWTLALNGFRQTGPRYIRKRFFNAPGVYGNAHTWVDVRAPDTAEEELRPEHKSSDPTLPPDTRRLAALRDGDPPMKMPDGWKVRPKVIYVDEPRPDGAPSGEKT
jgi:hypothetical protein